MVAEKLERKLVAGRARVAGPSPEVLEQVLIGRHFFLQGWPDGYRHSVSAYARAVALDPGYAPAWAGLGLAQYVEAHDNRSLPAVLAAKQKAFETVDRAIALDPGLAQAFISRGTMRLRTQDLQGAESDLKRARLLQPGDAEAESLLSSLHAARGRLTEAIRLERRAAELDPLNPNIWGRLAMLLAADGQLEPARAAAIRGVEIGPGRVTATFALGVVELLRKRPSEALPVFATIEEKDVYAPLGAALALHDLGRLREAEEAVEPVERQWSHIASYNIAEVYAWWGDKDKAFALLERSREQRDDGLSHVKTDVLLWRLRGDPRFTTLLRELNLPPD